MDLRQLRYFLTIVECGSISAASKKLHIAQPALSLHIKTLEQEFGCPLLHRQPRGVLPTESGTRLAEKARALLGAMASLKDEVRGLEAAPAGEVTIGIPTSLGTILTVPLVRAVRSRYPAVRLRVVEALSGHMQEWVLSGVVDLAVIFAQGTPQGMKAGVLGREALCLVGPRGEEEAGRPVPLAEALRHPLILPGRPHGVREEAERAALMHGVVLDVPIEVDALDQIKALVAEGEGYTILSHRFSHHGPMAARLDIRPIINPSIERVIMLAHAERRPLSIAAKAVYDQLRAEFARHLPS